MARPGRPDPRQFDFFAQQDLARRNTRRLLLWFALAAAGVVASYCFAFALAYGAVGVYTGRFASYASAVAGTPVPLLYAVALFVLGTILIGSAHRAWRMRHGGEAVAELLGARYLESTAPTAAERRLLNVVEEMAIASGIAVPPVYVLDDEAVNALVAGNSPNEAVMVVTRGGIEKLSRDELQGVIGHEFSHILNGDMVLNLRLSCVLAGLSWLGEQGEAMVWRAAESDRRRAREERTGGVEALVGAALAFVGHPGVLAADAIKAAISREREFLADAASVQFTRNPEGIAGALDSILSLRAHTSVRAAHAHELSHMFFAPVAGRWWSFPTHPPIAERIRRAHPRFQREAYREHRHGTRHEVAVLDGAGNVVKHVSTAASGVAGIALLGAAAAVARPSSEHVDYARRLLDALPAPLRDAVHTPDDAELGLFALLLGPSPGGHAEALQVLEHRRGAAALARVRALHGHVAGVARTHMLTLAELAVPAIKAQPQRLRDAFLADLGAMVEADRRVTLSEFVLSTFLRQRLREGAGEPIRTRFRRVEEVLPEAHVVLSLVALCCATEPAGAYARGRGILDALPAEPVPREAIDTARVAEALERLRHLAPLAKPAVLKACFEAAAADGRFRLAEVELVRTVAATLDCPVPPVIAAQDPQALAA